MGRPNAETRAAIARRRATALEYRLAGVDPLSIARKLAADPAINSRGESYAQGYGIQRFLDGRPPPSDRRLIAAVNEDITALLAEQRNRKDDNVRQWRDLLGARLERLFLAVYKTAIGSKAAAPDLDAVDRALRIVDRQARLYAADRDASAVADSPGGVLPPASLDELEHLIEQAGEPDTDDDQDDHTGDDTGEDEAGDDGDA